jgi:Putative zinc ribbon domain
MEKTCIACGMPLERPEDHPSGDVTKSYCKHCARPDGSMNSYDDTLAAMTAWIVRTQGIDVGVARSMAKDTLARLPAWKELSNAN